LGTIDSRPIAERRARSISSLWKLAALRQSLRLALRGLRLQRASPGPLAGRSRA